MYTILVCDDNIPFTAMFVKMLEKYTNMHDAKVMVYHNGIDLMAYCLDNKFDIVYMDVEVGKENGMSLARTLKKINPQVLLIYISAYDIYYKEMVNAEPFRFVSKEPCSYEELELRIKDSLDAAMKRINPQDIWSYTFGKKEYSVSLEGIKYFYSLARAVHIAGDTKGAPVYFYGKIDDIEKEIMEIDNDFVRISKSYLVNMRYAGVCGKDLIMLGYGGKVIPVTRKYREEYRRRMKKSHWTAYPT